MSAGDADDGIYLLMSGSVEVRLPSGPCGKGSRLDVFEAGMSFSEMGLLDGAPRSADVMALEPVSLRVLDRALFDRLVRDRPDIKVRMLEQIARQLFSNPRKANAEAAANKG
ncbi:MAG: glutaminase [Pseudomonadota bacterium]|jgi:CRP/FNR family cyclic AMP-dependent transcriptional regulator